MKRLKLKKILSGVLILGSITTAIGCTENNIKENNITENNSSNIVNSVDNQEVENDDNQLKEEVIDKGEVTDKDTTDVLVEMVKMNIYSKDVNTEEPVIINTIEINSNLSLEEKLNLLSENLSKEVFNDLPIEFVEIKEKDGKKIALFNLNELGENSGDITFDKYQGKNWVNDYFAGSAGGGITEYTLIETLLQRDYSGEWIDGVEFTYKNSNIEFDHVPSLGEVNYR